jgi:hypothetical protein
MPEVDGQDWRVTEGPAIGLAPEFLLWDMLASASFYETGSMSRRISARASAQTPLMVESVGRKLSELEGALTIYDYLPDQSHAGLCPDHFDSVKLDSNRGALALHPPGRFMIHLYLPPDQFELLLPIIAPRFGPLVLQIEVERTLDQGLPDQDMLFWNDQAAPVVLFNEMYITDLAKDSSDNQQRVGP